MARRLSRLQENRLAAEIKRMERDLEEMKIRQFLGIKNYDIKETETSNTNDVSTTVSAYNLKEYEVTFTADSNNDVYAQLIPVINASGAGDFDQLAVYIANKNTTSTNQTTWKIEYLEDSGNSVTLTMKFYVRSIDTGTITWVEV